MYIDNINNNTFSISLWGGNNYFNKLTNTLNIDRDCGLFSNITITMYGILRLLSDGYKVNNINFIINEYINNIDLYNILFYKNSDSESLDISSFSQIELNNCLKYGEPNSLGLGRTTKDYNISIYNTIYKYYFNFNNISHIINDILHKYNIDYNKSILIWARKTDKILESSIPDLKTYIDLLISQNLYDQYNIYLQTDDIDIINESKNYQKIIILNQLPFSNTSKGFHNKLNLISDDIFLQTYNMDKILYLKTLLALTVIASKCKYCVLYPGNLTTFIPIIKNTFDNCFSFKNSHDLLE